MKNVFFVFVCFIIISTGCQSTKDLTEVYAGRTMRVEVKPHSTRISRGTVIKGSLMQLIDCSDGFCKVRFKYRKRYKLGYVSESDISKTKPKETKSSIGCPTVQCSGTTQKGSRCRNRTKSCSGRCHHH